MSTGVLLLPPSSPSALIRHSFATFGLTDLERPIVKINIVLGNDNMILFRVGHIIWLYCTMLSIFRACLYYQEHV